MLETLSSLRPFLAKATLLTGGICRCDVRGGYMLEDERHWHSTSRVATPQNKQDTVPV